MSIAEAAPISYGDSIEKALTDIGNLLGGHYGLSRRTVGLLLLQGDTEMEREVRRQEGMAYPDIQGIVSRARAEYNQPLSYIITLTRQQQARRLLSEAVASRQRIGHGLAEGLSRAMMNPVLGSVILLAVLYLGLYQFVGVLGAGTLVDFIESTVFGEWINPWITGLVTSIIPIKVFQDLFIGEYGIITLGLTYAIAIILPVVSTFFIVFSIIEDSGYLPRLAMLIDRVFKFIGLNGRAVIPMVLGLGCDTMATIVTRTQETRRERIITTFLLALAIPCSAQLGVIFGLLSGNVGTLLIWGGTVTLVLLVTGKLLARIIPGERASFFMEVPPLRLPKLSNVMIKTYSRLEWYLTEVIPIFVLASVLIWLGQLIGLLQLLIGWLEPVVEFIGLPPESAVAFLYGFFRRDFGAAGLYDLHTSGMLSGVPLVVAAVTLTLFVPCVAQFAVTIKERGWKTAVAIALFIFPFAFLVGFVLNQILTGLGVSL